MPTSDPSKKPQTGVVIVTHADYGRELLEAAFVILGPQDGCATVGVDSGTEVQQMVEAIRAAVDDTDAGAGAIILTDMFGGTPTNLSLSLLSEQNIEVVTGVNLPMLLRVLTSRAMTPIDLGVAAKEAGVQGIVVAGELLRQKVADA
jgi:PTS system mannose-specific IIA component